MSRLTRDQWALQMAQVTARRATCLRRQVGCVLLNERGHVLATGYNGVAAGQPHCNEPDPVVVETFSPIAPKDLYPHACAGATASSGEQLDDCQAIHAEQNALLQCRDVHQLHTCYVTVAPCITCAKLLLNTSCQRIVFVEEYPHTKAERLWKRAGRAWLKAGTY